jgi:hypothetical protein
MSFSKFISVVAVLFIAQALQAQEAGFFLDAWQPKTAEIPGFEMTEKPTEEPSVNVSINYTQIVNKVPIYIYGNNAVTWDNGLPGNRTAMKDLKNLTPRVLRWPGGNLSNNYFWNRSPGQYPDDIPQNKDIWYGQNTADWQMSVDEYYNLLDSTRSKGIICVNYSYARYGTGPDPVATAAHMAAEWVRYDNGRTKFWEIGNENFGNWQAGYQIDVSRNQDGQPEFISGELYGQHCKVFIDSMRKAAAEVGTEIKIGVVTYDAENSHDPISAVWNEGMMPEVGDIADFLVVHSYFTPYNENSGVNTILNSHHVPAEIMLAVKKDMAEANIPMIPVAMTEWNIFAEGSMQQVSFVNGMLAALTLGEFVKNDYGLATRWDLVNGWNNGNDHGMFSVGGEPGVDPYNPRAVFFYMYYFQKYFGDRMVASSVTGSKDVIVHASSFSSGEAGLVLINKSREKETVKIDIEHFEPGENYYFYTLTGGEDNGDFSRKVFINGIGTNEQGGGPDEYESIKANASRVAGDIKVNLPPLAVVYVLVDERPGLSYVYSKIDTNASIITSTFSDTIIIPDNPTGFKVLVNGNELIPITAIYRDKKNNKLIHFQLEREVLSRENVTLSYSGNSIFATDSTPLPTFSNQIVANYLPGALNTVTIKLTSVTSGNIVENGRVLLNNEMKTTDGKGEVGFQVADGNYRVQAEKQHLLPTNIQKFMVLSDTTITLTLDSVAYNVTIQLKNSITKQPLSDVIISSSNEQKVTNLAGEADFYLRAGSFKVSFEKNNYQHTHSTFQIESDTVIDVYLQQSHAHVKFWVKDDEKPVNNALLVIGNDSSYTNALGVVSFENIAVDTMYTYVVGKELYETLQGTFSVRFDTSVYLQMTRTVANIDFFISSNGPFIKNPLLIFSQDTLPFNEGSVRLFNYPLNETYTYKIISDNFNEHADTLILKRDTTINILFDALNSMQINQSREFKMYPNPANDMLVINNPVNGNGIVQIFNVTGKKVLSIPVVEGVSEIHIRLSLEFGLYFVKLKVGDMEFVSKLSVH